MDTIFMNFENSERSDPHRLLFNLTDKINLRRNDKYVALSNLSIQYTWRNIKMSYKNNNSKISAPTWNEKFELPDGSYSISDIQHCLKYILKKYRIATHNLSIKKYLNKIENKIAFKKKTGYYLEMLTPEAKKLIEICKSKITKDKKRLKCASFRNYSSSINRL